MNKESGGGNLPGFLKSNGQLLLEYGSSEYGVSKEHALEFLDMLELDGLPPLGVEIWRYDNNWYSCDVMSGWYSTNPANAISDARRFLRKARIKSGDVFTIQF